MKLIFAIKIFFKLLGNKEFAEDVSRLLRGGLAPALPKPETPPISPARPRPEYPARSEAITLLAALQREGRFVDFARENLTPYSDAQIGAAVRDVHKGCAKALERMFGILPVLEQPEGTKIEISPETAGDMVTLVGNVAGTPPYRGTIQHAGWKISKCELPQWTGNEASVNLIAAAEVEVKG